jgi:hypothetical protein
MNRTLVNLATVESIFLNFNLLLNTVNQEIFIVEYSVNQEIFIVLMKTSLSFHHPGVGLRGDLRLCPLDPFILNCESCSKRNGVSQFSVGHVVSRRS